MPGTTAWMQTATATHVASTRPIESSEIGARFSRRSRSDAKNAAE
jgi:hypothetical protein